MIPLQGSQQKHKLTYPRLGIRSVQSWQMHAGTLPDLRIPTQAVRDTKLVLIDGNRIQGDLEASGIFLDLQAESNVMLRSF